jgi:cystathionine beta-lyase
MRLGMGVGADDAYLVLRGLPTMRAALRRARCGRRKLAAWLQGPA